MSSALAAELTDSLSPIAPLGGAGNADRDVLIGVVDARAGGAIAEALRLMGIEAELDLGLQGFPATVSARIAYDGVLRERHVVELAHYFDPQAVRLPWRRTPGPSVHQVAPRVASILRGRRGFS